MKEVVPVTDAASHSGCQASMCQLCKVTLVRASFKES